MKRSIDVEDLVAHLREAENDTLNDLREFVIRETPSTDKVRCDAFAEFLSDYARANGAVTEIIEVEGAGNHVVSRWEPEIDPAGEDLAPILLLGHYDTVWDAGTIETIPFTISEGRANGPGIFDMKCGLVQGFRAVRALRDLHGLDRPVVFLCNSDEEIGSPTSQAIIEEFARTSSHVLVFEPSLDGAIKTARKGVGIFEVTVYGKPSHAGLNPEAGVSATEELAGLIGEMKALADPRMGTTVNIGTLRGGTRFNVVAAEATAGVDVRVATHDEAERIEEAFTSLTARHPGASISVGGGMMWPPMERTEKIASLYHFARERAHDLLGFELREGAAGGASDGCHCAATGAAVIDGLGAVGGGAHARDEHVDIDRITERTALAALLISDLDRVRR